MFCSLLSSLSPSDSTKERCTFSRRPSHSAQSRELSSFPAKQEGTAAGHLLSGSPREASQCLLCNQNPSYQLPAHTEYVRAKRHLCHPLCEAKGRERVGLPFLARPLNHIWEILAPCHAHCFKAAATTIQNTAHTTWNTRFLQNYGLLAYAMKLLREAFQERVISLDKVPEHPRPGGQMNFPGGSASSL